MSRVDFLASMNHYLSHLLPIWHGLPPEVRGTFFGTRYSLEALAAAGIEAQKWVNRSPGPVCVASWADYHKASRRPVALVEHGAGQIYVLDGGVPDRHPSNSGGVQRERVRLFLDTNEAVSKRNREAWPDARSVIIGAPKLDRLKGLYSPGLPVNADGSGGAPTRKDGDPDPQVYKHPTRPTVALSFHWMNGQTEESRWALPHYQDHLAEFAQAFPGMLGHAHPRAWRHVLPFYEQAGIEPVESLDDVFERASIYAVDNSSSGLEFAAVKGPVVWLNSPKYRRDVNHGGRFWDWAALGQCDGPEDFVSAVDRALNETPAQRRFRETLTATVYPGLGTATQVAVKAICDALEDGTLDPF